MRRKEGDKGKDILDAAIRVFARDGFDRAQITAIASEANIGTGSVYLYFRGKDEILDGIFERFWTQLLQDLEALAPASPFDGLRAQLALLFDHLVADTELARVYLRESHRHLSRPGAAGTTQRQKCLDLGEATFHKGTQDGTFRADLPLGLARSYVFGGIRSALSWWIDEQGASPRSVDATELGTFRDTAVDLSVSALLRHAHLAKRTRGSKS